MFDKKKKIIVNYGSPFMAKDYFPLELTYIEMNCDPNVHSIKNLADGLVGELEFTGKPILHS